jgi:hypothetical protein
MKYHKPEIRVVASAIAAVHSPESDKADPQHQDNLIGHPISFGSTPAYQADE